MPVTPASAAGVGLGDTHGVGLGVGDTEAVGVGLGVGEAVSDAAGDAVTPGDAEGSGDTDGVGDAETAGDTGVSKKLTRLKSYANAVIPDTADAAMDAAVINVNNFLILSPPYVQLRCAANPAHYPCCIGINISEKLR